MMKIVKLKITKADWDKIPSEEQLFYIYIGHLRNEITILRKLFYLTLNNSDDGDILSIVYYSQKLVLIKILFGKFEEGWKFLTKGKYKIANKILNDLNQKSKNSYDWLEIYFTDVNKTLAHKIRHNFAFHYNTFHTENQIPKIKDDDIYQVFVAEKSINFFSAFSEEILWRSLRDIIAENDNEEAIKQIRDEIENLADHFSEFCDGCLMYMFEKYSSKPEIEEISISDFKSFKEHQIPFFLMGE